MEKLEDSTQEERKEHLRKLGWDEAQIAEAGELPWQILLVSNRPLTPEEEAHALTLVPTLGQSDV